MALLAPMKIRNLVLEDIPALRDIAQTAVMQSVDAPKMEKPKILDGIFENLSLAGSASIPGAFLISEIDATPAGFLLIKNYWNLSDLFVSPSHHGQGIGRAIWTAALPACQRLSERDRRNTGMGCSAGKTADNNRMSATSTWQLQESYLRLFACNFKISSLSASVSS